MGNEALGAEEFANLVEVADEVPGDDEVRCPDHVDDEIRPLPVIPDGAAPLEMRAATIDRVIFITGVEKADTPGEFKPRVVVLPEPEKERLGIILDDQSQTMISSPPWSRSKRR